MADPPAAQARLNRLLQAVGARRTRVFVLALVVTLAFLILPTWTTWTLYQASERLSSQELRLRGLVGSVVHLDEVLTMSARMAAATGDPRWEERYRRNEPALDAAIEEMIRLAAGTYQAAAERAQSANRELIRLEKRAFDLARADRRGEAAALLASDDYQRNKRAYADGIGALASAVDARLQLQAARSDRLMIGAGALTVASAGMLLLAWVGVGALLWRHLRARQRAERERAYLEAQIQHVQKLESLGVLAGGIAHDFNNLLMPILGNAQLALDDLPPGSPARARLRRLQQAGRRLSELTEQLLAYTGKGVVAVRPLDLSALVEDMAPLLEMSISKHVVLKLELARDLPAIEGDAAQIGQVVMNLISNASEAVGDEPGVITLRTGLMQADRTYLSATHSFGENHAGPYVYLEVEDSGCGMDAATQRQIFDPFFTTKFTGRGLGLAVTLGIVRSHWGALRVDSQPGHGTTLRILFGASQRAAEPAVQERSASSGWLGSGTVLVIDDEPDVLELVAEMIRRFGLEVLTAQRGRAGVETFRQNADRIAVVLLDLTMADMSGGDALQEIRAIRPDQPVALMSGYDADFVAGRLTVPVGGFLQKPFSEAELGETLRSLLGEPAERPARLAR